MTTLRAESGNGSLVTGLLYSPQSAEASKAEVIFRDFSAARPLPLKNTRSLSDAMASLAARNPGFAERMSAARTRLGERMYGDEAPSLASLRLRAGLSQAALAAKIGSSQPHLARIEKGHSDPGTDLIARIADALDVDASAVFTAIRAQRDVVGLAS